MDNTIGTSNLSPARKTIVGIQFLFVAFGATVLVPLLVGLDPATALFTAGLGTFIFHLITKGKVPIFLGSSFALLRPSLPLPSSGECREPWLVWQEWRWFISPCLRLSNGKGGACSIVCSRLLSSGLSSSVSDCRYHPRPSIWPKKTGCWPSSHF